MSSADWWARQMGAQPAQREPNLTIPPSQIPMTRAPQQQQQGQPTAVRQAPSSMQTATCPECMSGNYWSSNNNPAHCFDCGYPMSQAGSRFGALTGAHVEGNAKSALGNPVDNNYHPTQIIGRV